MEATKEKISSLEVSLQSAKDTIFGLEKDLQTSNARFRWFEYKLGETERKLSVANLEASNLKEVISGLNAEVELWKEQMAWVKDETTDQGIDAGFKIFW